MMAAGGPVRGWALPLHGARVLDLSVDSARLRVVPLAAGAEARLEVAGRDAGLVEPRITPPSGAARLSVDLRPAAPPPPGYWEMDVVAHVPPGIELMVDMQGGAVEIAEMDLPAVTIHMLAGQVRLVDVGTRLTVSTSAGQVIGRGLRGSLDVSTAAGQIDLDIVGLEAGRHVVQSEAGAIRLGLRPGLTVGVDAHVGVGVVLGAVPSAPDAAAQLRVQSQAGTVQLTS